MKQTPYLASGVTLAILLFCGCSDQSGDSAKADTSQEDIAAIENVFAKLKDNPESLSVYAPAERPLIAYFQVAMARIVSAFQTDEAKKKASEQGFTDLIKKHNLTDTLEFTDNEDRMKAVATTSFADVDLDVFMIDVRAFIESYGSVSLDGDSEFEDEEEGNPVSMQGLKLNGDEAKATVINTDETEQPFVFVKSDDQWFVSWERTYGGEEDGSDITYGESFIVTFENEAALENATAKKLLEDVVYDRSSRPTLRKTGKPLQAELEFYVPAGGEADGIEASSERHEARMDAIKNSPGVKDVETSFGVEMREAVQSGIEDAFQSPKTGGASRKSSSATSTEASIEARVIENQKDRAEAGGRTAQYDLGMRYLRGNGVEQDTEQARHWLQLAAAQRDTRAKKELAQLEQPQTHRTDVKAKQYASREAEPVTKAAATADEAAAALTQATQQLWANQESAYFETRRRTLAWAAGTAQVSTAERVAKLASLYPSSDASEQNAALALAQNAVRRVPRLDPFIQMAHGMAAFRAGQFDTANRSLIAAEEALQSPNDPRRPFIEGTGGYYRAMSLFHQDKKADASQLYRATLAKMKPLPADVQTPLANGATHDDLIVWLAYKEAKALLNE